MNWLLKIIQDALLNLVESFINFILKDVQNIFNSMYELNRVIDFSGVTRYIRAVAAALLVCLAVKQAISIYALEDTGDSDADPIELLKRLAEGLAAIFGGAWLIEKLIAAAGNAEMELLGKLSNYQEEPFTDTLVGMMNLVGSIDGKKGFWLVIMLVVILVGYVILLFKAAKRGAELILSELALPIFACDLITTNRERWKNFFMELCVLVFGYIVQLLCFKIFLYLFGRSLVELSGLNMNYFFGTFAWMLLTLNAPKWIKNFTYSSGAGEAVKGGARSVAYLIPNIIRK